MKRFIGIIMLSIILIIAGQNLGAQNYKFGYINRDELLKAMPDYDSANVKLENLRKELVSQLALMQDEFTNKTTAFNNGSMSLSDVVRKTKEQELKDLNNRIQLFQVKATQQINDKNAELIQPILAKADKAIKDVAKEQGFTFVFDVGVLYYFDEKKSINILPLIKTKLGLK
jgi:outer membrane protein